jgi:hypothetical protein
VHISLPKNVDVGVCARSAIYKKNANGLLRFPKIGGYRLRCCFNLNEIAGRHYQDAGDSDNHRPAQ